MTNGQTMHTLPGPSQFPTTRWTLVVAAGDPHRKEARSALVSLCENYWYPLVCLSAAARLSGRSGAGSDAGVLHARAGRAISRSRRPGKGPVPVLSFDFLEILCGRRRRPPARAANAAAGCVVPLEFSSGEERYQREPAHDETPERIFERRWALSVLDRVVEKLRNEFVQHGRPEHFERLKVFLLGQSDAPYAALAREMNTSEGALKVAIHRLRKRYRELFRQEIADTVADPAEVESELRFLAAVLTEEVVGHRRRTGNVSTSISRLAARGRFGLRRLLGFFTRLSLARRWERASLAVTQALVLPASDRRPERVSLGEAPQGLAFLLGLDHLFQPALVLVVIFQARSLSPGPPPTFQRAPLPAVLH